MLTEPRGEVFDLLWSSGWIDEFTLCNSRKVAGPERGILARRAFSWTRPAAVVPSSAFSTPAFRSVWLVSAVFLFGSSPCPVCSQPLWARGGLVREGCRVADALCNLCVFSYVGSNPCLTFKVHDLALTGNLCHRPPCSPGSVPLSCGRDYVHRQPESSVVLWQPQCTRRSLILLAMQCLLRQ